MLVATAGPNAVATTKRQIATDLLRHDPAASVADSLRLLDEAMGTAEYREGVAALRAKRPPNFDTPGLAIVRGVTLELAERGTPPPRTLRPCRWHSQRRWGSVASPGPHPARSAHRRYRVARRRCGARRRRRRARRARRPGPHLRRPRRRSARRRWLLALLRPSRVAGWLIVGVNAVAVGGWALTRVTGISWIDGLQVREDPQFADAVCAGLGALAVAGALAAALIGWQSDDDAETHPSARRAPRTVLDLGGPAPRHRRARRAGDARRRHHTHSHDLGERRRGTTTAPTPTGGADDHGAATGPTTTFDESQPHTHDANGNSVRDGTPSTIDESQPHSHDAGTTTTVAAASAVPVWPPTARRCAPGRARGTRPSRSTSAASPA